jgi:putative transposase
VLTRVNWNGLPDGTDAYAVGDGVSEVLSRVKVGKDAVSSIASRLQEEQREWRERSLEEKKYPYLYLDATYLKVRWGSSVSRVALLACVGVDDAGSSQR